MYVKRITPSKYFMIFLIKRDNYQQFNNGLVKFCGIYTQFSNLLKTNKIKRNILHTKN